MNEFFLTMVVIVIPVAAVAYAAGKHGLSWFFDQGGAAMSAFDEMTLYDDLDHYIATRQFDAFPCLLDTYTGLYEGQYSTLADPEKAAHTFGDDDKLTTQTPGNGLCGAIEYVRQNELAKFGDVQTPLDEPESVGWSIAEINGWWLLESIAQRMGVAMDDKLNERQQKEFKNIVKNY